MPQCLYENRGKMLSRRIGRKLRKTKFSILVDESADVSTSQNFCIMVRFADASEVVSKFWGLMPIFTAEDPDGVAEGATGRRIFSAIMKTLSDFDIPVANMLVLDLMGAAQ